MPPLFCPLNPHICFSYGKFPFPFFVFKTFWHKYFYVNCSWHLFIYISMCVCVWMVVSHMTHVYCSWHFHNLTLTFPNKRKKQKKRKYLEQHLTCSSFESWLVSKLVFHFPFLLFRGSLFSPAFPSFSYILLETFFVYSQETFLRWERRLKHVCCRFFLPSTWCFYFLLGIFVNELLENKGKR